VSDIVHVLQLTAHKMFNKEQNPALLRSGTGVQVSDTTKAKQP